MPSKSWRQTIRLEQSWIEMQAKAAKATEEDSSRLVASQDKNTI